MVVKTLTSTNLYVERDQLNQIWLRTTDKNNTETYSLIPLSKNNVKELINELITMGL